MVDYYNSKRSKKKEAEYIGFSAIAWFALMLKWDSGPISNDVEVSVVTACWELCVLSCGKVKLMNILKLSALWIQTQKQDDLEQQLLEIG